MMRSRANHWASLVALAVALGACGGGGPDAPELAASAEVCIDDFCSSYPADWILVETGTNFVSFKHPASDDVVATVGRVSMEGIATNAGAAWPVPHRDVVDLLWSLLDGGEAELANVRLLEGGAYDSWGRIATGRLWHRLIPVTASRALGVEVRAPNASWEDHADVFRQGLTVLSEDL